MGRLRKKRMHVNNKAIKKKYRTKRRTKDLDQIQEDMEPLNAHKLTNQIRDQDLPGEGQHYCLHCARYFINDESLKKHFRTKLHKRRLAALREPVYTQKEAEMAAGMGSYILPLPPLESKMKTEEDKVSNESIIEVQIHGKKQPHENEINKMISLDKQLMTLKM